MKRYKKRIRYLLDSNLAASEGIISNDELKKRAHYLSDSNLAASEGIISNDKLEAWEIYTRTLCF